METPANMSRAISSERSCQKPRHSAWALWASRTGRKPIPRNRHRHQSLKAQLQSSRGWLECKNCPGYFGVAACPSGRSGHRRLLNLSRYPKRNRRNVSFRRSGGLSVRVGRADLSWLLDDAVVGDDLLIHRLGHVETGLGAPVAGHDEDGIRTLVAGR
jgi:hypothetical protein